MSGFVLTGVYRIFFKEQKFQNRHVESFRWSTELKSGGEKAQARRNRVCQFYIAESPYHELPNNPWPLCVELAYRKDTEVLPFMCFNFLCESTGQKQHEQYRDCLTTSLFCEHYRTSWATDAMEEYSSGRVNVWSKKPWHMFEHNNMQRTRKYNRVLGRLSRLSMLLNAEGEGSARPNSRECALMRGVNHS